jgi:hypothetical protein
VGSQPALVSLCSVELWQVTAGRDGELLGDWGRLVDPVTHHDNYVLTAAIALHEDDYPTRRHRHSLCWPVCTIGARDRVGGDLCQLRADGGPLR